MVYRHLNAPKRSVADWGRWGCTCAANVSWEAKNQPVIWSGTSPDRHFWSSDIICIVCRMMALQRKLRQFEKTCLSAVGLYLLLFMVDFSHSFPICFPICFPYLPVNRIKSKLPHWLRRWGKHCWVVRWDQQRKLRNLWAELTLG